MSKALDVWTVAHFWETEVTPESTGNPAVNRSAVRVWSPAPLPGGYAIDFHHEHTCPGPPTVTTKIRKASEWLIVDRVTAISVHPGRARVLLVLVDGKTHGYRYSYREGAWERWVRMAKAETHYALTGTREVFPELF